MAGFVEEWGQGIPLVFLPSMLVLARSYRPVLERLSEHFQLIVVEMPGSGRAQVVSEPWSFDRYACWLAAFIQDYGLRRVIVLGHSDSGAVALRLAARRPDLISSLVVVDTVGVRRQRLGDVLAGRGRDGVIEWKLTVSGFHHPVFNIVRHGRNFWALVRNSASDSMLASVGNIGVPTLVCWGTRDHTMPVSYAADLAG
ncbi:MAG: alpha/beta fold hydrolase, partial [Chloroflexi bacterium]|nr:alpha/beta fold hydrolase [Chloroflexota bacterium]